jgi:DNA-binding response OmpR family regulator
MSYRDLTIDQYARRVWLGEQEVKLTRLEFDVLAYLFERLGATVSREELLEQVWGDNDPDPGDMSKVKSCIRRLRAKLGENAHDSLYIVNVWGVGYQLGK